MSNSHIAHRFTRELYLTAATHLSSRAFPSTLLSDTPSLVSTPTSYPVLLPGVDALNHARAQPVSWAVGARGGDDATWGHRAGAVRAGFLQAARGQTTRWDAHGAQCVLSRCRAKQRASDWCGRWHGFIRSYLIWAVVVRGDRRDVPRPSPMRSMLL